MDKIGEHQNSIEEILRKRDELDRILRDEFHKEVTILFTDICGYTKFMEAHGDIAGRAMLQRHNEIVHPLVGENGGRVVKTIGDAVMAAFENPETAVACAVAIQEKLARHNASASPAAKIEVKIGVNCGDALVDKGDLFGDAVNVASRIQSVAGAGEILVSSSFYDRVRASDDILCRYHAKTTVKGKTEPLDLYRVVWRPGDTGPRIDSGVRGPSPTRHKAAEPLKVLQLEMAREENRLKISAHEQIDGETSTVRHYEEMTPDFAAIAEKCRNLVEILNKTNRMGKVSQEILRKLREIGQVLADELFTPRVKETLNRTAADHLLLTIDDQLVQVPWELLHDGKQFLCQRFSMGRLVKTRQNVASGARMRGLARPLRMLVVADPRGDLKGAYREGTELKDAMDEYGDLISVAVRSDNIDTDFIKHKIRNFDLVHYAGHADYNREHPEESGWLLTNGSFTAGDIMKMAGSHAPPALIFSNACQSARTEEWALREGFQDEIFGLANAFLLAGVKHYIGTFWEILDAPSRSFGLEFYRGLLSGECVGEAMRQARLAVIREYGEETIVWASYMLYGDPTFNYLDHLGVSARQKIATTGAEPGLGSTAKRGGDGELIDFNSPDPIGASGKRPWALVVGALLILVVGAGWWFSRDTAPENFAPYEQTVLMAYKAGNYAEAAQAAEALLAKDPDNLLPVLVRGGVALQQGEIETARATLQQVVAGPKTPVGVRAAGFMGLGRIASLQGETDQALDYYRRASELRPDDAASWQARAMVLRGTGRHEEAMSALDRAADLAPDNRALAALARQTRAGLELAADREKQQRIDQLVEELLEAPEAAGPAPVSDNWTSRPLTAWIMDMEIQGYGLQEGKESMLTGGLTDRLLGDSRVRVVERAVLDKLLAELKLGSSNLADQGTALTLGRLLAARLLVVGKIIHAGTETRVSLRLIETETGSITASLNEIFPSAAPADLMVEKLFETLQEKIEGAFPLRGRISGIDGEEITVNIGRGQGVGNGQRFSVSNGVATLEVIATRTDTCLTRVVDGEKQLMAGLKVEEI